MAIYPIQLFIVCCPTFRFSKLVRPLVEPYGYINCEKCRPLKRFFAKEDLKLNMIDIVVYSRVKDPNNCLYEKTL